MKRSEMKKINLWAVWSENSREIVFWGPFAADCVRVARTLGGDQYKRAGFKVVRFGRVDPVEDGCTL